MASSAPVLAVGGCEADLLDVPALALFGLGLALAGRAQRLTRDGPVLFE